MIRVSTLVKAIKDELAYGQVPPKALTLRLWDTTDHGCDWPQFLNRMSEACRHISDEIELVGEGDAQAMRLRPAAVQPNDGIEL